MAPGTWPIWTKTKTKTTGEMLTALFGHINKMRDEDPTQREYDEVLTQAIGSFPLGIETADQVAGRVRTILTFDLPPDYWKTYRDEVRKVQLPDIRAMAKKYMNPTPIVVLVGRADKVEPQVKEALKDAVIVHYNTDLECTDKSPLCAANKPLAAATAAPAAAKTAAPDRKTDWLVSKRKGPPWKHEGPFSRQAVTMCGIIGYTGPRRGRPHPPLRPAQARVPRL